MSDIQYSFFKYISVPCQISVAPQESKAECLLLQLSPVSQQAVFCPQRFINTVRFQKNLMMRLSSWLSYKSFARMTYRGKVKNCRMRLILPLRIFRQSNLSAECCLWSSDCYRPSMRLLVPACPAITGWRRWCLSHAEDAMYIIAVERYHRLVSQRRSYQN